MNSESDVNQCRQEAPGDQPGDVDDVVFTAPQLQAMRQLLHELANVFTGIMIADGLLSEYLEGTVPLGESASGLYQNCERGRQLVWELRGHLLAPPVCQPRSGGAETNGAADSAGEEPSPAAAGGDVDQNRRQR